MIKFVYFDLGGVAELDYSKTNKWEELMHDLGLNPGQYEDFEKFFND